MATCYIENMGTEVTVTADPLAVLGLIEINVDDPDDEYEYLATIRLTRAEATALRDQITNALKGA